MKCENCKSKISDGAEYCPYCGIPVNRESNRKWRILGIVLSVLTVALLVAAFFIYDPIKKSANKPENADNTIKSFSNDSEIADSFSEETDSGNLSRISEKTDASSDESSSRLEAEVSNAVVPLIAEPAVPSEDEWSSYYQPVFDCAVQVMKGIKNQNYNNTDYQYDFDYEMCGSSSGGLRLGYRLQDIDQNGIPELIIGLYEKTSYDEYNDCILALFTLDNNYRPIQLFYSVVRGMHYFSSLGDFSCRGSGGAADTVGDVYKMRDGELLVIESGGNNSIPFSGQIHYFHFKCPEGIPMVKKFYQSDINEYYWDKSDKWYELRDQSTVTQDEAHSFTWGLGNYNLPIGELKPIEADLTPKQPDITRMDIANQYAINIFLSNFSEQGFNEYNQNTDWEELIHFAYLYAKINGRGRYNLSTVQVSGNYYYTLPVNDLNTIITRFFDRSLPETMQYTNTEPNKYRELLNSGYFYAVVADGEMYNKFTVVDFSADNGDGTYDVRFTVYRANYVDPIPTEYYYLTPSMVSNYSNLSVVNTGYATVKPYNNNGNESFQLLKYGILN